MAIVGLIGTTALLAGCGESRHENQQRPNVSTRISVTISPKEVIVQPLEIGMRAEATQEIPQNENDPEPPIKTKKPLDVTVVVANQTPSDAKLKLRGAKEAAITRWEKGYLAELMRASIAPDAVASRLE